MGFNKEARYKHQHFVMLHNSLLFREPAWKSLSAAAKLAYIYLKAHFNGKNNGDIEFHYRTTTGIKGLSSPGTVSKALRELEREGWIEKKRHGGLYRYSNYFKLTEKYEHLNKARR